ncbi:MAG: methyltransferase domain-containing protein [Tepidiformaceae bacterium]
MPAPSPLRPEHFERLDETDDELFYREARLVTHIDDPAIEALRRFYGGILPAGGAILDLMSSWVSHLPPEAIYSSVTGLGMNEEELAANPCLTAFVVQDLNRDPRLPFPDADFGGGVATVSVQYLTNPVPVFAEVGRVLAPGAPFAVTFSNRCFPTKAIAIWRALNDRDHATLVATYFRLSGAFEDALAYDLSPDPGRSDPLYAVVARALPLESRQPPAPPALPP